MTHKIINRIVALTGIIVVIAGLSACKDMFKNPLLDKETGDKVTVLLIDRNFVKTKLDIRLQDMATLQTIDQEEVEIRFLGNDATNLITFSGNKRTSFTTSSGYVEVGYDPNIVISDQSPIELTVVAISPNYISAPQFISFTTDGTKSVIIKMIHKTSMKSASTVTSAEPFDIYYNGVLGSSQLLNLGDISSLPTGTAYEYINLYSTMANGTVLCNNLSDNIIYSDYGVYYLGSSNGPNLVPPALPTKNAGLQNGDMVYSTVLRSGLLKCGQGLTIHVERADGKVGTGEFDYLITFSDGKTKSGKVTGTFPYDYLIEQIYYPASNPAVSVALTGDAQYDISAAVNLSNPCGGKAEFLATPKSNLKTYKFITQYICPDSQVGMGLSILGEYRKSGSSDPWTSFEFVEGICELQLQPGPDYDFRVNIDAVYHLYSLPTDPAVVESYILEHQNADYTIKRLLIDPTDSLVTITIDVELSQAVCDVIQ